MQSVGDGFSAATAQLADAPVSEDVLVKMKAYPAQGGRTLCRADSPQAWSPSSSHWEQDIQDSRQGDYISPASVSHISLNFPLWNLLCNLMSKYWTTAFDCFFFLFLLC